MSFFSSLPVCLPLSVSLHCVSVSLPIPLPVYFFLFGSRFEDSPLPLLLRTLLHGKNIYLLKMESKWVFCFGFIYFVFFGFLKNNL